MSSAALLKIEIEGSLARKIPGALSPRAPVVRPMLPTGIDAIDSLLAGGLPVGGIVEVIGAASSGRTTLGLSVSASAQRQDHFCAWIDASDAFDPESAAAAGIQLERLLWVRCGAVHAVEPWAEWHVPLSHSKPPTPSTRELSQSPAERLADVSAHMKLEPGQSPAAAPKPDFTRKTRGFATQPQSQELLMANAAKYSAGYGAEPQKRKDRIDSMGKPAALSGPPRPLGGGSPHPRTELRNIETDLEGFLSKPASAYSRDKTLGTPGVTNWRLQQLREQRLLREHAVGKKDQVAPHEKKALSFRSGAEESAPAFDSRTGKQKEQVATDRLPARRGSTILAAHQHEHRNAPVVIMRNSYTPGAKSKEEADSSAPLRNDNASDLLKKDQNCFCMGTVGCPTCAKHMWGVKKSGHAQFQRDTKRPWDRIAQALRATDLLLQDGGFGVLVLDLGSLPPAQVNRIPIATWFRYRAAADKARCVFLLLTQHPCARSSAEVVLQARSQKTAENLASPSQLCRVMQPITFSLEVVRQRYRTGANIVSLCKPVQPERTATWRARPAWQKGTR